MHWICATAEGGQKPRLSCTLVIDPLDFGADEYGADMTSDFEFSLVGPPVYTYPAAAIEGASTPLVVNGRQAAGHPEPELADA